MKLINPEGISYHIIQNSFETMTSAVRSFGNVLTSGKLFKEVSSYFTKPHKRKTAERSVRDVSIPLQSNSMFDREGETFTALRKQGAYTLGELQAIGYYFRNGGITVWQKNDSQVILIDPELSGVWQQITQLAFPNQDHSGSSKNLQSFAENEVLFVAIDCLLQTRLTVVDDIVTSPFFEKSKQEFCNKHLVGFAIDDRRLAQSIAANFLFEQWTNQQPSKIFSPETCASLHTFFAARDLYPKDRSTQSAEIIAWCLSDPEINQLFFNQQEGKSQKWKHEKDSVIPAAEMALRKSRHELIRHKQSCEFLEQHPVLNQLLLGPDDGTVKLLRRFVSMLLLAQSPAGEFSMAGWFPQADYYEPSSNDLPQIPALPIPDESAHDQTIPLPSLEQVSEFLMEALSSQDTLFSATTWQQQQELAAKHSKQILHLLGSHPEVPQNVRDFFIVLQDPTAVAKKILQRFGSERDYDYLIVNRFFSQFSEFCKMIELRYALDFVRGFETELILETQPLQERVRRMFVPQARTQDFSNVSTDTALRVLHKTLEVGSQRIRALNHEDGASSHTLKDLQEQFEHLVLYDTYDMKFLRWKNFWDVWHTLGGGWDCICFTRKSIFNCNTAVTY